MSESKASHTSVNSIILITKPQCIILWGGVTVAQETARRTSHGVVNSYFLVAMVILTDPPVTLSHSLSGSCFMTFPTNVGSSRGSSVTIPSTRQAFAKILVASSVVALLADELPLLQPARYADRLRTNLPYPGASHQTCDLCLGIPPKWDWTIEVKMLRWMGDNGKPNDNMLTHILSPYPADRSALTDCLKLLQSSLHGRRAILIYGFDYHDRPMDPVIDEFELIASRRVQLSPREVGIYDGLIHPVHQCGRVFGWEIIGAAV